MKKIKEITFELTDFCEHNCKYCSSNCHNKLANAKFIPFDTIYMHLKDKYYETIILSGGEPLAHPEFYHIYNYCKQYADDVIVYSNLITHRIYNANVIDGVYLEANITVTNETNRIRILKRVEQGKEKTRPEVKFSKNYTKDCNCDNIVIKPDGKIGHHPCDKWSV